MATLCVCSAVHFPAVLSVLGQNVSKLAPNETNLGLLRSVFSRFCPCRKLVLTSHRLVPFGANLDQFWPNFNQNLPLVFSPAALWCKSAVAQHSNTRNALQTKLAKTFRKLTLWSFLGCQIPYTVYLSLLNVLDIPIIPLDTSSHSWIVWLPSLDIWRLVGE